MWRWYKTINLTKKRKKNYIHFYQKVSSFSKCFAIHGNFLKNLALFFYCIKVWNRKKNQAFIHSFSNLLFSLCIFSPRNICNSYVNNDVGIFWKVLALFFLLYQVWKSSKSPSQNWMALYNLYHCASIRVIFAKFVPTKEIWYLSDCVTLVHAGQIQFKEGWKTNPFKIDVFKSLS